MPHIICEKKDCFNNESGECMVWGLCINAEGFCCEYSPKFDPDDPGHERV